ncbi:MAG: class I SAM-dependent methyltransferase [Lachnospiraceae bacterium]|nr:class I SAM-dependent methyltransferase [Lachnospiraceae bacterium]
MATSYEGFAYLYDQFMNNIPYDDWSHYLLSLLEQYDLSSGTLIELGCGTGTLTTYMAHAGYHIFGIDNSVDMLTIAADKTYALSNVQLLLQNMQDLNLGDLSCDGAYCLCDSLNYLLTDDDILSTFCGIRRYVRTGGYFIFDLKTRYFYEEILGDQIFCDHQEQGSYIWENSYFEEDSINQYDLTFFAKSENGLYEKFNETHHQRAYDLTEIIDFLQTAGLEYVTAYNAFTKMPPAPDSERIYIIARNGDISNE